MYTYSSPDQQKPVARFAVESVCADLSLLTAFRLWLLRPGADKIQEPLSIQQPSKPIRRLLNITCFVKRKLLIKAHSRAKTGPQTGLRTTRRSTTRSETPERHCLLSSHQQRLLHRFYVLVEQRTSWALRKVGL